ncbi:hypothetical protein F5Y12DRAFT_800571 [Xylaria sp. FL1777]|nr:hypothetical protein F5Y12DRAFT_800571 [Xylaria sp. FL1777]
MSSRSPDYNPHHAALVAQRLQLVRHSREEQMQRLYACMNDYVLSHPDPAITLKDLLSEFNRTFETQVLGSGTDWLEEILWEYIWKYMDDYRSRLAKLLRCMMTTTNANLYDHPVTTVLSQIQTSAMENPWQKWVPFCEIAGQLARDEYNVSDLGSCNPGLVLAILIHTFDDFENPGDRKQLVVGAAKCVLKLGRGVTDYIRKNKWAMNTIVWGVKKQHITLDDWEDWSERFRAFGNDVSQHREARVHALNAGIAMRGRTSKHPISL